MQDWPLVSLITINYDHIDDTVEFLESALKLHYPNIEIIVVDNDSPKEKPTPEIIKRFPTVNFIQSEKNLGFAGGNNLGIKAAKGDFLFLLNNDTIVFPDFLEPIVEFMVTHPNVGMASPKVLYPDGKTLQFAGGGILNPFTGRQKCYGMGEQDDGQYDVDYKTDMVHGGALIIPKKVVDEIGPMPEIYFLYYEELDWCESVKRAGYEIHYLGFAKILHKESISTGSESRLKIYYMTRGRLLFMRRNFSGLPAIIGFLFFSFISVPKNTVNYLITKRRHLIKPFFEAIFWNFANRKID
jgi:GT2 family glycosyltransferase